MGIAEILCRIAVFFPEIDIRSKRLECIEKLGLSVTRKRYAGLAITLSLLFSIITLAFFTGIEGVLTGIAAALVCFSAVFLFLVFIPEIELKQKAAAIESEMPLALRTIGMLLNMHIPFTRAMRVASESGDSTGNELHAIVEDIDNGATVHKALSGLAMKYPSVSVKRSVSRIISAYETGGSGTEVMRMGDELMSIEQHKLKEYSSKSAIFGLLFIVVSTIVPVFFLVYCILGDLALGADFGKTDIAIGMLVLFPMASTMILLVSRSFLPPSPFHKNTGPDPWPLAMAGAFMMLFLFVPEEYRIAGVVLGCIAGTVSMYGSYTRERKSEDMERYLPDALFSVAALPKSAKMENIFGIIEGMEYGELSKEAGKSRIQMQNNVAMDAVLEDLWKRNQSVILKRVAVLLKHVFESNSLDQLNGLAEDILKSFGIKRERAQVTGLQKYTLLLGAMIIPVIMGMTFHLLSGMSGFFEGKNAQEIIAFSSSLVLPYAVIYSIISASYISDIEGRRSLTMVYFLAMLAVSAIVYYLFGSV